MSIAQNLQALRVLMRQHKLDYYLVPGSDPHQNEYLPLMWERRAAISGFDGSNGDVLIGLKHAYLWTDGRYQLQASQQLDPTLFEIFIFAQGSSKTLQDFFKAHTEPVQVGVDPMLIDLGTAKSLTDALSAINGKMVYLTENLVDSVIKPAPFKPQPIQILTDQFTGEPTQNKLKKLRNILKKNKVDALILSDLPSIAWLFNLRGTDIPYNPLFLSYAIIEHHACHLYLNAESATPLVSRYLHTHDVQVKSYPDFYGDLSIFRFKTIQLDPKTSNQAMLLAVHADHIKEEMSPTIIEKALKNPVEIEGSAEAHRLDALALTHFFVWLEKNYKNETEFSIAETLLSFRAKAFSFQEPSFPTIAGYAENGAIIHYHAHFDSAKTIGVDSLLLIDSGGQYLEGTTDVTRTLHLGSPSPFEQECYTLVLKGQLALRRMVFAAGTRGEHLDAIARQFLWKKGLNYGHGTGHGVGAYLCVHEGPHRISTAATTTPLQPGMIVSNEPGVYLPGQFGIRIENLVHIVKRPVSSQDAEFYGFEDLTLVPYARNLFDFSLLSDEDRQDINDYHATIWKRLSPDLSSDALAWLKDATLPI